MTSTPSHDNVRRATRAWLAATLLTLAACGGPPGEGAARGHAVRTADDHLHQVTVALVHALEDPAAVRALHARIQKNAEAGLGEYLPLEEALGSGPAEPAAAGPSAEPQRRFTAALSSPELLRAGGVALERARTVRETQALLRDLPLEIFWPNADAWDGVTVPTVTYAPDEAAGPVEANHGFLLDGSTLQQTVVDAAYAAQHPVLVLKVREELPPLHEEVPPEDGLEAARAVPMAATDPAAAAVPVQFAIGSVKVGAAQVSNVFGRKAARAFRFAIAPTYTIAVVGGRQEVRFPKGATLKTAVLRFQDGGAYAGVFLGLGTWLNPTDPKRLIVYHLGQYSTGTPLHYREVIPWGASQHAAFRWWVEYQCNGHDVNYDAVMKYGFPEIGEYRTYPKWYFDFLTEYNVVPRNGLLGANISFTGGAPGYWNWIDLPTQITVEADYVVSYAGNDVVLGDTNLGYDRHFGTRKPASILASTKKAMGGQAASAFAEVEHYVEWPETDLSGAYAVHRLWYTIVTF